MGSGPHTPTQFFGSTPPPSSRGLCPKATNTWGIQSMEIDDPGIPIDHSISIDKISIDWYRSIDDQSITTQKPFIDWHSNLKQTSRTILVRSAPIFRRPWGRGWQNKSGPVFSTQSIYPVARVLELPLARHCLSVSLRRRKKSRKRFY